jgi:FMN phosphatase YigB (HAD superfamily)
MLSVGSYKPDLRNFQYALEQIDTQLGVHPREVLCVAQSKYHDVRPYVLS